MKVKATKIFAIIFVLHLKVFNAAPPNPFIMVRRDAVVRCGSKNNDESPLKKYLHKGVLSGNDEMGTPRCYKVRKSLCKRVPRYSLIFSSKQLPDNVNVAVKVRYRDPKKISPIKIALLQHESKVLQTFKDKYKGNKNDLPFLGIPFKYAFVSSGIISISNRGKLMDKDDVSALVMTRVGCNLKALCINKYAKNAASFFRQNVLEAIVRNMIAISRNLEQQFQIFHNNKADRHYGVLDKTYQLVLLDWSHAIIMPDNQIAQKSLNGEKMYIPTIVLKNNKPIQGSAQIEADIFGGYGMLGKPEWVNDKNSVLWKEIDKRQARQSVYNDRKKFITPDYTCKAKKKSYCKPFVNHLYEAWNRMKYLNSTSDYVYLFNRFPNALGICVDQSGPPPPPPSGAAGEGAGTVAGLGVPGARQSVRNSANMGARMSQLSGDRKSRASSSEQSQMYGEPEPVYDDPQSLDDQQVFDEEQEESFDEDEVLEPSEEEAEENYE